MRIAWFGLGKLGMPCALALAAAGHTVRGYDPAPGIRTAVTAQTWPHDEPGATDLLRGGCDFALEDDPVIALTGADVVFVAVQTPHGPDYEGATPMPDELAPFDVSCLANAVRVIAAACPRLQYRDNPTIVVVSTVLPGTCRDVVEPILGDLPLVYSPAFVAMGTVLDDLRSPEFILAGCRDDTHAKVLQQVYAHVDAPIIAMGVESAELAKVAYNTAISTKIVLANALGELADATGADVDEVSGVLELATDRVASGRYLRAGMGDGGPCHPRDGIAMAWLADRHAVSADPFLFAVRAREAQAAELADLVVLLARDRELPVVICGRAYKPGVSIDTGSPSRLVAHYIKAAGHAVAWLDPQCGYHGPIREPAVFLVALPDRQPGHYPPGSVVIDPCGAVIADATVEVIRPGRNR